MAIIGIDATALSTSACGGIGAAQYQTMRALVEMDTRHRFILYAAATPVIPFSGRPLDLPWPLRLGSGPFARSNIVWMQTGINRLLAEDGVEVLWGPRHLLPFRARGIGMVATVHDFSHRDPLGRQQWLNRRATGALIERAVARADVVVVPSEATARDVARFCGVVLGAVRVVPWGVDQAVFRPASADRIDAVLARLGVARPYVLALDVFNPRKNFVAVLEAVSRLPEGGGGPLTVVGLGRPRKTFTAVGLESRAEALGVRARLRLPGDVDLDDLVALYSGARALVYPSRYEGFGLPVLEAMACGCPVIAGDRSSIPEVAGRAALLVDPDSADDLARAIARLDADGGERALLVAAGRERAGAFTWGATAEGMMDAFERALAALAARSRRALAAHARRSR